MDDGHINDYSKRLAAEKLAAEYQSFVLSELMKTLSFGNKISPTTTNITNNEEDKPSTDPRLN